MIRVTFLFPHRVAVVEFFPADVTRGQLKRRARRLRAQMFTPEEMPC